jgi:hypothetical protein
VRFVEVSVRSTFFNISCGLLLLALSGCGDDEDSPHDNLSPNCKAIVDACHEADPGEEGAAHQCHETGEANNAGQCTEALPNCLSVCQESGGD